MNRHQAAVISTAGSYVGYFEKETNDKLDSFIDNIGTKNYTLFGKWYGMNGEPWCAIFVSFVMNKSGIPWDIVRKFSSCGWEGVPFFKEENRWHSRNGYTPQPADIIFFTSDGFAPVHVGIVEKVDHGKVYTIEGNTSTKKGADGKDMLVPNGGGVARKSYPFTSTYILGYGNPDYAWEDKAAVYAAFKAKGLDLNTAYWWPNFDKIDYSTDFYEKWAKSYK